MKTVILCGGKGLRLREYTNEIPKPLVKIGGKPILWHIMKYYAHYGFNDFILCLGYKKDKIINCFKRNDEFNIRFVDTGLESSKGERLFKVKKLLAPEDNFWVAYADDLSDVNLGHLLDFHRQSGKIITLLTVKLVSQFGILDLDGSLVTKFVAKPTLNHWINSGFYVVNRKIFEYLKPDEDLEVEVFKRLVDNKEMCAFKHNGFWQSMNTFKDWLVLDESWWANKAPWKVWE